jgi:hypothetical protein
MDEVVKALFLLVSCKRICTVFDFERRVREDDGVVAAIRCNDTASIWSMHAHCDPQIQAGMP